MRKTSVNSRKLRYGGVTAVLTALIVAAVIILNIIVTVLSQRFLWQIDMTPDLLYSISDECVDLIRNGDDNFGSASPLEMVDKIRNENKEYNAANGLKEGDSGYKNENEKINIIFCDDIDTIQDSAAQRYVYNTALELQTEFPEYIEIKNYNVYRNPSAVSKYLITSGSSIATTSVIIEFGTEFRVYSLNVFFTYASATETEPWAYNGEKKFTSAILAVTRAESPVACLTVNHGESFADDALYNTLVDAGYVVQTLDLASEEIPEDCRLIVVYNPNSDFLVNDGVSNIDEIEKLDDFLDGTNSMMTFMSPDSPRLNNFENYMEEWGVVFDRHTDASGVQFPYMIKDSSQSLTTDGFTIVADYAQHGLGGSITSDMRNLPVPKKVIFPRAMSISYAPTYKLEHYTDADDPTIQYDYGSYYSNGISRTIGDMFLSSENAVAHASGAVVEKATEANPFKLMTVSVEERTTQEDNYTTISEASYVVACGSVEFATTTLLDSSSYGNTDLLLSALRAIGREPVPVGLDPKPFADYTIDTITTAQSTQYTVVLTAIPAVVAIVVGAIVLIRRKNK